MIMIRYFIFTIILALLNESGTGKHTNLHLILGLFKKKQAQYKVNVFKHQYSHFYSIEKIKGKTIKLL